jgi:uroporphyrinogen decarboxylase
MTGKERVTRSIEWKNPNSLVVEWAISARTWLKYREALEPIARRMPNDFYRYAGPTDYDKLPPGFGHDEYYEDPWGCLWHCRAAGMQGIIEHHPLASWDSFKEYKLPDPWKTEDLVTFDPGGFENKLKSRLKEGCFIRCNDERLWERIHFLRGFENAMLDIADDEPRLHELIDRIVDYNIESTRKFLEYSEVDCIAFQDDWGEQFRLMINPEQWRYFFFDAYKRQFQSVHEAGKYVYFHTDGYLLPIVDDLHRAGADVINLQSGCQTLEELYKTCYKKVCVSVDLDRQKVMPFGTTEEMKQHVRDIYNTLEGAQGGVWVKMDVYPDTPLENIQAMAEVFEELRA